MGIVTLMPHYHDAIDLSAYENIITKISIVVTGSVFATMQLLAKFTGQKTISEYGHEEGKSCVLTYR